MPAPTLTAMQMLKEARQNVPEVSALEALQRLERGEVDLIVDVREQHEWDRGHIPGALHLSRSHLEFYADPTSPSADPRLVRNQDASIIVQCASGVRSLLAGDLLKKMGYTHVTSMAGGINAWVAEGGRVER